MSSLEQSAQSGGSSRPQEPGLDRRESEFRERRQSRGMRRQLRDMKRIVKGVGNYTQSILSGVGWNPVESDVPVRVIGFTSHSAAAGVSMLAAQTAMTAALLQNAKVLLVDASSLSPSVHRTFGCELSPGFRNALRDETSTLDAIHCTAHEQLFVMPFGEEAGEIPNCEMAYRGLFKTLAADFQLVVVDLPAIAQSNTFLAWLDQLDATLLVIPSGRESRMQSRTAANTLQVNGANKLSVVLNRFRPDLIDRLYCTT